jgi:hypothetical protein
MRPNSTPIDDVDRAIVTSGLHRRSMHTTREVDMDERRFDAFTRSISRDSSRRGTLRLLASGALAGLVTDFGSPHAEANHFGCHHVGKSCTRSGQCCSGRCRGPKGHKTCRAHGAGICMTSQDACTQGDAGNECGTSTAGACVCLVTTGGAPYCAQGTACFPCTKDKTKDPTKQCYPGTPGAACVVCPGCQSASNPDGTACALPCPNPTS